MGVIHQNHIKLIQLLLFIIILKNMSDTDGEKVDEVKSDPEIHEEAGEAK